MRYILKVTVRSTGDKPLPDWGLGPGVLGEKEIDIPDDSPEAVAAASLLQAGDEFIDELVEVETAPLP